MSKPRSRLIDYASHTFRTVFGYTTELHFGKQAKHIADRHEHIAGRSVITISVVALQALVEQKAGTGDRKGANKEVVDFGVTIVFHVDSETGKRLFTFEGVGGV